MHFHILLWIIPFTLLGASYLTDVRTGMVPAIAVIVYQMPQRVGGIPVLLFAAGIALTYVGNCMSAVETLPASPISGVT